MALSINGSAGTKMPGAFFVKAAAKALPKWDLSLAFVHDEQAAMFNKRYRDKTYAANVLSFPLSEKSGEILLNLDSLPRECKDYDMEEGEFALFLFIHGCLHLAGQRHSATMETTERKLLAQCLGSARKTAHGTKNSNGNRHRNASGQNRRHRRGAHE